MCNCTVGCPTDCRNAIFRWRRVMHASVVSGKFWCTHKHTRTHRLYLAQPRILPPYIAMQPPTALCHLLENSQKKTPFQALGKELDKMVALEIFNIADFQSWLKIVNTPIFYRPCLKDLDALKPKSTAISIPKWAAIYFKAQNCAHGDPWPSYGVWEGRSVMAVGRTAQLLKCENPCTCTCASLFERKWTFSGRL